LLAAVVGNLDARSAAEEGSGIGEALLQVGDQIGGRLKKGRSRHVLDLSQTSVTAGRIDANPIVGSSPRKTSISELTRALHPGLQRFSGEDLGFA
jgi:hypothetical protein